MRLSKFRTATLCALLFAAFEARADDPTIAVDARLEPASLALNQRAKLLVDITIPSGFHLWSFDPGPGPQALTISIPSNAALVFEGAWHGDQPIMKLDRGFNRELALWEKSHVHLERVVKLVRDPAGEKAELPLSVRGQICTEEVCVGQRLEVKLPFAYAKGEDRGDAEVALNGAPLSEATHQSSTSKSGPAVVTTGAPAAADRDIVGFLLIAFFSGLLALATPCVFPAIPLTISFFSKYSHESFSRGARLAAVYALTMMATFTTVGVLVSVIFGVAGVSRFAAHPVFNLVLALVLAFFALNLLGLFEIQVPAFVLNFTNKLEAKYGRGSGMAKEAAGPKSSAKDYLIVAVAAVTATTVFFTCTVAFVGTVITAAANGEWFWPTIGMLAFSFAFSMPFFLLAMFPNAARRLRGKAGDWMSMVRVTLGFVELAAAMKFLSNSDLVWHWNLVTRNAVLALWVPLFALCGLYLLGKLRFGETSGEGEHRIGVLRMLSAAAVFALTLHLAVGLFSGRSFGGWIDGLLPPVEAKSDARFVWMTGLDAARKRAAKDSKLVFANYTGYTCTNCRYMEGGVFPSPEVAPLLDQMVLVELYTDGGMPEHDRNRDDQVARFKTAALPFYSVERADGTVLGTFASSTNDAKEFAEFLREAISHASVPVPVPVPTDVFALDTQRLDDGVKVAAVAPGKWTLVNFWASWCAPCILELKDFLIARGGELEAHGGRFVAIAVEEDDNVDAARKIAKDMSLPPASAYRISSDAKVDPKLRFDGATLPHTVLIAPNGDVVWTHSSKLERDELEQKLKCFMGDTPSNAAVYVARKC